MLTLLYVLLLTDIHLPKTSYLFNRKFKERCNKLYSFLGWFLHENKQFIRLKDLNIFKARTKKRKR